MTASSPSRSSLLLGKLRAVVGAALPGVVLVDGSFPGGAALLAGEPPVAWVLLDENPIGSFGSALVVAGRQGASSVEIVVDDADAAGVIARRAALFAPPPRVRSVQIGRASCRERVGPYV